MENKAIFTILVYTILLGGSILWNMSNASNILNLQELLTGYTKLSVTNEAINDIQTLTGDLNDFKKDIKDKLDRLHNEQVYKNAKIYNLEITICRTDKIDNLIEKRKIQMHNVVAINPSLTNPSSAYLDTGLGYGNEVEIPDVLLQTDAGTYACGLNILSIK